MLADTEHRSAEEAPVCAARSVHSTRKNSFSKVVSYPASLRPSQSWPTWDQTFKASLQPRTLIVSASRPISGFFFPQEIQQISSFRLDISSVCNHSHPTVLSFMVTHCSGTWSLPCSDEFFFRQALPGMVVVHGYEVLVLEHFPRSLTNGRPHLVEHSHFPCFYLDRKILPKVMEIWLTRPSGSRQSKFTQTWLGRMGKKYNL